LGCFLTFSQQTAATFINITKEYFHLPHPFSGEKRVKWIASSSLDCDCAGTKIAYRITENFDEGIIPFLVRTKSSPLVGAKSEQTCMNFIKCAVKAMRT